MKKILLVCFLAILFSKNAKSQMFFYVQNDTTDLTIKKALNFFKRNFCSIETHNFQSFLKSKERNIYYRVFKNENGKQFHHFSPVFSRVIEGRRQIDTLKSDCHNYSVDFIKKSFKKFDHLNCYLSIVHLLRNDTSYYLSLRVNETYRNSNWFDGWETTFVFTFDKNLALKKINYSEGIND